MLDHLNIVGYSKSLAENVFDGCIYQKFKFFLSWQPPYFCQTVLQQPIVFLEEYFDQILLTLAQKYDFSPPIIHQNRNMPSFSLTHPWFDKNIVAVLERDVPHIESLNPKRIFLLQLYQFLNDRLKLLLSLSSRMLSEAEVNEPLLKLGHKSGNSLLQIEMPGKLIMMRLIGGGVEVGPGRVIWIVSLGGNGWLRQLLVMVELRVYVSWFLTHVVNNSNLVLIIIYNGATIPSLVFRFNTQPQVLTLNHISNIFQQFVQNCPVTTSNSRGVLQVVIANNS